MPSECSPSGSSTGWWVRHWPEVDAGAVPVIDSLEPLTDIERLMARSEGGAAP